MQILSILSTYVPDVGDFLLVVISALLSFIVYYSKKHIEKTEEFMTENTASHLQLEKKLENVDTWTRAIHKTEIEPTVQKADNNENEILTLKGSVKDHEGRIIRIEKKVQP